MTGTTTGGLVYPVSSEPVRDGATRMQYFLEQLDQDPIEILAYRDSALTVPNQAWTKVAAWAGQIYQHGTNSEIAIGASGVQCKRTGRYWIDASWEHPDANANGHVGVAFLDASQATAPGTWPLVNYAAMLKASGWKQEVHGQGRLTLTSGLVYTIWVFQSSGAAVAGNKFRLNVAAFPPGQSHS